MKTEERAAPTEHWYGIKEEQHALTEHWEAKTEEWVGPTEQLEAITEEWDAPTEDFQKKGVSRKKGAFWAEVGLNIDMLC